jgi:hypothetical protein
MPQGVGILQALQGLKLQAGAIEAGVAESMEPEEGQLRKLLASLPPNQLPQGLVAQLAALGVHYSSSGAAVASAANDFDCSGSDQALGVLQHSDSRAQQVLDVASLFADASDLKYMLEHLEELSPERLADQLAAAEQASRQQLLSQSAAAGMPADAAKRAMPHLILDDEIEILVDADGTDAGSDAGHGGHHWAASSTAGRSDAAAAGGAMPSLDGVKTIRLSVLGQLKAQRTQHAHAAPSLWQRSSALQNVSVEVSDGSAVNTVNVWHYHCRLRHSPMHCEETKAGHACHICHREPVCRDQMAFVCTLPTIMHLCAPMTT